MTSVIKLDAARAIKAVEDLLTIYKKRVETSDEHDFQELVDIWESEQRGNPKHVLVLVKGVYLAERGLKLIDKYPDLAPRIREFHKMAHFLLDAYRKGAP